MLRKFAALAVACLVAAFASPALARHGAPAAGTVAGCSYSTADSDGCASAQARGYFKTADLYTYGALSGQTWASHHPQPFDVAGVDYYVGHDTTLSLLNPRTATTQQMPAGCTYNTTGAPGSNGPYVFCKNAANPSFIGWDFYHGAGAGGTDDCIPVRLGGTTTGEITFDNDFFENGPNCNVTGSYFISVQTGNTAALSVTHSTFEGAGTGGYTAAIWSSGIVVAAGPFDAEYNYFHNMPTLPISGGVTGVTGTVAHNVIDGIMMINAGGKHGATFENLPALGSVGTAVFYSYNTGISSPNTGTYAGNAQITAMLTLLSTHGAGSVGETDETDQIDHNTIINNKGPGGIEGPSTAMSYLGYKKLVVNYIEQDNYIDPTGANNCVENLGGGYFSSSPTNGYGFIDDGQGGGTYDGVPGNVLTVTALYNGGLWPGATLHGDNMTDAVIQPPGTVCDGVTSNGTGQAGTYCLSGSPQATQSSGAASIKWETLNTPITNLTFGGTGHENINMTDGSVITKGADVQWGTGVCNNHF